MEWIRKLFPTFAVAMAVACIADVHSKEGVSLDWGSDWEQIELVENGITNPISGTAFGIAVAPYEKNAEPVTSVDGWGKTLIISNENSVFRENKYDISATNEGGNAGTILLDNLFLSLASVSERKPFTVRLNGFNFCFLAEASGGAVGLGIAETDGDISKPDFVYFDPNGAKVTWLAMGATATVFGVAKIETTTCEEALSQWLWGNFAPNSLLIAAGDDGASIFGCGSYAIDNDNSFCNWSIGDFGQNTVLTTSARASTIFGPGSFSSQFCFCNWTIGKLADGIVLVAKGDHAAVFGAAELTSGSGNCKNWTVEFQGNGTVATLGNSTAKLGTLGGAQNNNMRFYFNDLDARSPSVILAALRFGEGWEVKGGENSITAPISESGNVLALGQNFQLNVGRKRTLDENWTTLRDGEPNGVNDCPNGTWETNNSILTGGSAEGVGPGTLHLLGAVAALESTSPAKNSILRVDSGWKVNCYQSVRGFATIEIIDGTVELRSGQDDDAFNAAATELMANIVTVDRGGKFYRNSANSELEIPGDCRTGNLAINLENFPVAGGLVLDSNSKIIFGTALDNLERHVQKGALILHGDGTGENPQLTVDQNGSSIFGLDLAGNAEVPSDNFPINCWIVQMPKLQDSDNVGGLLKGIEKGKKIGSTDYYGVINGENLIAREGTEYSEVANLQLLWCEDPDSPGLHLATVNEEIPSPENPFQPTTFTAAAPRLELSNYARSFAHGALAELGIAADRALLPEENLFHRDEGLFLWSQHARLHRTTAGGFGYRGNLNGGSVGWIRVRTFSQRLILGRGALASYANVRTKFFGSAVSRGKELRQWRWNGVAFATLEYFNAHQRLSRFRVAAGGGLSRGRASREDGQGKRFSASLGGAQAFASLAGFRELLRPGNWQIGPRVELIYNWQRQNAYAETSDAALGAATVDGVGHHFLTTALGLGLGKNFANRENANRGGQISSALAWNCQAMRHHNRPTARIQGTGFDEFSPLITYGERNFATISLKMHRHLDRQWTISFYWRGDFAHGRTDFRAGAQLCHKF